MKLLAVQESAIAGKTIYITGSIPGNTKDQLEALVEKNGGIWKDMSKSLDLLVIGENAGPAKLEKAKSWGLKTMNAQEFLALINIK